MSDEFEWCNNLKENLGEFVYFWNAEVSEERFDSLAQEVTKNLPDDDNATGYLVLTTSGGQADAAYRSIRFLHEIFSNVIVVVPAYCKSAGTLMVLGAHELHMSLVAELGPLDVQIRETDELFQVRSGLNSNSAFEALSEQSYELFADFMLKIKRASRNAISFKLSSDIAANITTELMAPIYAQLNPQAIGSDYRKLHTATAYGKRLSDISHNLRPNTLDALVSGYPDHGFVIDFREAQELFKSVKTPDACFFNIPNSMKFLTSPNTNTPCVLGLSSIIENVTPKQPLESDASDVEKTSAKAPAEPSKRMGSKSKRKTSQ